jgi:hypothetical protein
MTFYHQKYRQHLQFGCGKLSRLFSKKDLKTDEMAEEGGLLLCEIRNNMRYNYELLKRLKLFAYGKYLTSQRNFSESYDTGMWYNPN